MKLPDIIRFAYLASTGYPTRTLLMLLAMAIGAGSVVTLSTLGDGARNYVVSQFSSLAPISLSFCRVAPRRWADRRRFWASRQEI